jgi:tetratricopeptide (TPR) repeat protein
MSKSKNRRGADNPKPAPAPAGPPSAKPAARPPAAATPAVPAGPVMPLFRGIDWWAFAVTAILVMVGYLLTLAPNQTLEDSGELSVAAHYAGIPHPPGYPVWTLYTWCWIKLLPLGNIAWRAAVASAFAGALACGLVALMVSRGSSMILEGIAELKNLERRLENALCLVAGFVSGMLIGFNGFMWSQAVIVEVYTLSVLSLMVVLLCLLRWLYAPHQHRYLYLALFTFGICFTNHQTLIVAAIGIEVLVAAANPKMGRDLFLGNSIIYIAALLLKSRGHLSAFDGNPPMFVIFNCIGILSIAAFVVLWSRTRSLLTEWRPVLVMGLLFVLGVSFYLYMAVAGMSTPPLNWGYPRTVEGFWHALTRGQYEKANPANIINDPLRFVGQIYLYFEGAVEEFSLVYLLLAIIPWVFFKRMARRERAWMLGLAVVYLGLALLLLILLNPQPDRQSKDLNRVFFTASHFVLALWIGYGLSLLGAFLLTQYETYRRHVMLGACTAAGIALYALVKQFTEGYVFWLYQFNAVFYLALMLAMVVVVALFREKLHLKALLSIFALMPVHSIAAHWWDNEQRGHLFGYWFGHDMFKPPYTDPEGKPLYPEMERDTVLFGGTDPGRFNPTYMIFSESFTPRQHRQKENPDFDRRDVYLITQNALADGTYLNYIRAQYNRSAQIDPPFFVHFFKTQLVKPLDDFFLWLGDEIEISRRAGSSYFQPEHFKDLPALAAKLRPGPQQDPLGKPLYEKLPPATQALLAQPEAGPALARALAKDLNKLLRAEFEARRKVEAVVNQLRDEIRELNDRASRSVITAEEHARQVADRQGRMDSALRAYREDPANLWHAGHLAHLTFPPRLQRFIAQDLPTAARIRMGRQILEAAFPAELAVSEGGVYPDLEILTPTYEDSQQAFNTYIQDAYRRLEHDQRFPNEPRQLKPGEEVRLDGGRVQVSGQVAVMAINGLLTKVIFDKNPDHEFYVEESFPLDWMYPHLTPHGIILKINRQPLPELTEDILRRDHLFWRQYGERTIGDWITYDTPVKEICDWAERVYLRRDLSVFKGNRKFIRDDNAQKAFSKLRSAIGGVYAWRINQAAGNPAVQQRLIREADFTFKQAFAFCPYSPEAIFRYVNILVPTGRIDDAIAMVEVCHKLDPEQTAVKELLDQLRRMKAGGAAARPPLALPAPPPVKPGETSLAAAAQLLLQQRTPEALAMLDQILADTIEPGTVMAVAQHYLQLQLWPRLETAMRKMTTLMPDNPEAHYDLAGAQAVSGRFEDAVKTLQKTLQLSDARRATNPAARDLRQLARVDARFAPVAQRPDFRQLIPDYQTPAPPPLAPPPAPPHRN